MISANQEGYIGDSAEIDFRVTAPPVADIHYSVNDRGITFDGGYSYDPDGGEIISYLWTISGVDKTGSVVDSPLFAPEYYNVILTVVDDEGQKDTIKALAINGSFTKTVLPLAVPSDQAKIIVAKNAGIWSYMAATCVWTSQMGKLLLGMVAAKYYYLGVLVNPKVLAAGLAAAVINNLVCGWVNDKLRELGEVYSKFAVDPPDDSYEELAEIEQFETLPLEGEHAMEIAILNLGNNSAENQAILKALTTSIERFFGAVSANDNYHSRIQSEAISNYSKKMVDSLDQLADAFDKLISEIEVIESNSAIATRIEQIQQRLVREGFTEDEIDYFKSLGANDAEIVAFKELLLNYKRAWGRATISNCFCM